MVYNYHYTYLPPHKYLAYGRGCSDDILLVTIAQELHVVQHVHTCPCKT